MQRFSSLTGKKILGANGFGRFWDVVFFPKFANLEFLVLHLASKQDTLLRLLATERAAE